MSVACLQRLAALLLTLGLTLALAAAYLQSPLAFPPGRVPRAPIYSARPLAIALPLVVLLHAAVALAHAPPVLARVGVHAAAYGAFVLGLGSVFAGLALWGVLS